jgi:hypothetical protein
MLDEQGALGRKVRVQIMMHNEPSQRMCTALGFVEIGREPPFIEMNGARQAQRKGLGIALAC